MKMKTSEFIRLSGTTPRTLRYYEEKKAIMPTRDTENAYHYYTEEDLIMLWESRSLNSIGISIDDIPFRRENTHTDNILASLTEIQHDLDEKILELERRLKTVISTKHRYEMLEQAADRISDYSYQRIYRLFVNDPAVSSHPAFDETIRKWAGAIPQTKFTMTIDHTQLTGNPDHLLDIKLGLGISQKNAAEAHLPTGDPVVLAPRCSGGMCVLSVADPMNICERDIQPLLNHAQQKQCEITGDFHARLSHISMKDGHPLYHFFLHSVLS